MKKTRRLGWIVVILAATALTVVTLPSWESVTPTGFTTQAMPAWSRRYKSDCSLCHTTYPRLNRTGYEFKRLGYRFNWEVEAAKGATTTADVNRPGAYVPAPVTDSSRNGEELYKQLECNTCHAIAKVGGEVGPALDGIGEARGTFVHVAHGAGVRHQGLDGRIKRNSHIVETDTAGGQHAAVSVDDAGGALEPASVGEGRPRQRALQRAAVRRVGDGSPDVQGELVGGLDGSRVVGALHARGAGPVLREAPPA